MRVAETAQRSLRGIERPAGLIPGEDVVLLVARRAVADFDAIVDHDRASRQIAQVLAVVRRQGLARPGGRESGNLLEATAIVEAACRLVVIAADHGQRIE